MELPVYKIVINEFDESGCTTISLVDDPAVEMPFLCFDKQEAISFKTDDDRQIISGIAMLADTPIYRYSPQRGEYYIVFEKETIRTMVEKYAKNGFFNLVNLQHQSDSYVDSVHMIESMIIDKERGLCPVEFKDVPDGSWYISFHVEDKELWNEIKTSGMLNGFSIEILSDLQLIENKYNTSNYMNKLFKFAKTILKLAEIKTDKETLIIDGELEIGKPVFIETEEGPTPAADGEYILEDGRTVVILEGVISEIREVKEETVEITEETLEEPENDEKDAKIAELEGVVAERDARIAELEAKIAELEAEITEKDEKLKMSVETPVTKKVFNIENKALKYF